MMTNFTYKKKKPKLLFQFKNSKTQTFDLNPTNVEIWQKNKV